MASADGTDHQRLTQSGAALVLPEGVPLGFEVAGPAARLLARALDLVMCTTALYVILLGVAFASPPLWVMVIVITVAVFAVIFVYPALAETLMGGRTVGKIAVGLLVVTDLGAPIGFRHAAARSALSALDLVATAGFAGLAAMMLSERRQRFGDLAAGTVVIRTRGPRPHQMGRSLVPEGYDSFIASLDTQRLDRSQVDLVRDLLVTEAHGGRPLDAQVVRLAEHVDADLGGRRPVRMPYVTFLECVLAADAATERRARPLVRAG